MRGKRYLLLFERQRIATLRGPALGMRSQDPWIDRPSTISRELGRNVFGPDGGIYDSNLAHARARQRARRRRNARLAVDDDLRLAVQDKLDLEWSPEQISGWLRRTHPNRPGWHLCHEIIYQAVYNPDEERRLSSC